MKRVVSYYIWEPFTRKNLKRALAGAAAVALLAGATAYGSYFWRTGRFLEATDDAYLQADYTTVAPKVSGYIAAVAVEDNQEVTAGQVLARIDDSDFRIALDQAKADVATARADIDAFFLLGAAMAASVIAVAFLKKVNSVEAGGAH